MRASDNHLVRIRCENPIGLIRHWAEIRSRWADHTRCLSMHRDRRRNDQRSVWLSN